MRFTQDEAKRLAFPVLIAAVLAGAGAFLLERAGGALAAAGRELAAAQAERRQHADRLSRIAEEEREVRQKVDIYRRLRELHVLGEEQRLEWADAIARIRQERELLDLRYRVERQQKLFSAAGKPADVDFYASRMSVDLALLHEEDLLRFLSDLRDSGNAFYSVRRCTVERTGQAATGVSIVPRLRAACEIDLITIVDRAAKQ
ncbi:MAG TPA: hypothetical protein VFC18_15020 [Burkholderiales bacterium]|nr:hypothetical protein [Burkholderiales bacterium]